MPPATGTPVELGGKTRTLRVTTTAFVEMEQHEVGKPITDLCWAVWAALGHEKPRPSFEDVLSWIDPTNYEAVSDAMAKALEPWMTE